MPADARARLAARQSELVEALHAGSSPAGVDAERVRLTSDALVRKRARMVARAWPVLTHSLEGNFGPLFAEYARRSPPPDGGGGIGDGLAFARSLRQLPGEARAERLLVGTEWVLKSGRVERRRGAYVGVHVSRGPLRVLVGLRLPRLGVRFFSLGDG